MLYFLRKSPADFSWLAVALCQAAFTGFALQEAVLFVNRSLRPWLPWEWCRLICSSIYIIIYIYIILYILYIIYIYYMLYILYIYIYYIYIIYIIYISRRKWDKVQSGTMGKPRVYATVCLKYLEIIYAILCYNYLHILAGWYFHSPFFSAYKSWMMIPLDFEICDEWLNHQTRHSIYICVCVCIYLSNS